MITIPFNIEHTKEEATQEALFNFLIREVRLLLVKDPRDNESEYSLGLLRNKNAANSFKICGIKIYERIKLYFH